MKTRHIEQALDLCEAHNILITEKMAEDMTLPKTDSGTYTIVVSCIIGQYEVFH